MKSAIFFSLFFLSLSQTGISQTLLKTTDFTIHDRTSEFNIPQEDFIIANLNAGEDYQINLQPSFLFSCVGLGWKVNGNDLDASIFKLKYRTKSKNGDWSAWQYGEGDYTPNEIPSGHYKTELLFTYDATNHEEIEIHMNLPLEVSEMIITLFDGNFESDPTKNNTPSPQTSGSRNCPDFPSMITRAQWCGGSAPCIDVLAGYTPQYISPTHVVIHYGASPQTYVDGQAVVRSYWNWHVNNNGWVDIGYNYIVDIYGNFYQGRHNPNLPNTDVRGAHAGAANSGSIGINFPGNTDNILPTTAQVEKLEDVLAWWFDHKGYDPTSSAMMQTQAYGVQNQPRITGHRDVGSTFCPGNVLHGMLPSIRANTQTIINNCNNIINDLDPPTTVGNTHYEWRGYDFWMDFDDNDNPNGSGVSETFYQVMDFDGTEWRANKDFGFFNDNFNQAIHPDWTTFSGNWSIANNTLYQDDESEGNTNMYISLNQEVSKSYLYQWSMMIDGTGTNRRGGLHFFADAPQNVHRGNSYLAWFRLDDNAFHLYKILNDNLDLVVNIPVTLNANTWYDIKVTFDPSSGKIETWLNDQLISTYTDPTPITSGDFISLRNGDSEASFNNLKVRTNRIFTQKVTVGNNQKEARYESPTTSQEACRVNTIIRDVAGNWSSQHAKNIYIDWTLPTTSSNTISNWQTNNFNVTFNDNDNVNGSGIAKRFYQVIDFDGTDWRANDQFGFFSDNFDLGSLHPDWTQTVGSWNASSNILEQTDETIGNTNIYVPLNQNTADAHLYHFYLNISGTNASTRRGGFHYHIDDPTLTNRGNSYFIWFRPATQNLEFYKVVNDTFTQEKVFPIEFIPNTWYDIKLIYDKTTGEHLVYMNDKIVGEWIDPNPLTTDGDYISFRSGNSNFKVNEIKIYKNRGINSTVTLGSAATEMRYQNNNPTSSAGKVKSIVMDHAQNLSDIFYHDINVDWTQPVDIGFVNDGNATDIDTFYTPGSITANWASSNDPNSGIAYYEMSIGTSPLSTDILNWQNVGNVTLSTANNLTLVPGTIYYVNIRAVNNAGLISHITHSDGQFFFSGASIEELQNEYFSLYPNPAREFITIKFRKPSNGDYKINIYNAVGKIVSSHANINHDQKELTLSEISEFANGVYHIHLIENNTTIYTQQFIVQ